MVKLCIVYFLQKVSEKVGGAEGTKLDEDFMQMEKVSVLQSYNSLRILYILNWNLGIMF